MKLQAQNLSRKFKLLAILTNDFLLALICWLVFGPPMATYIASEFSTGILDILMREWLSFVLPASASIIFYMHLVFTEQLLNFLIQRTLF